MDSETGRARAFLFGTVLALGDSLTFGARSPGGLGYPELLGPMMTEHSERSGHEESRVEWVAVNRGISKETTREILDRTPAAMSVIASSAGLKWCVILAGTNDSKADGTRLVDWEKLYRQIVHWPRRYKIPVALCTFPPIRPGQAGEFTAKSRIWLEQASARVRAMVAELDGCPSPVRLVDLERTITEEDLIDGVHLRGGGYAKMARAICDVLTDEQRTPTPTGDPLPPEPGDVPRGRARRKATRVTPSTEVP